MEEFTINSDKEAEPFKETPANNVPETVENNKEEAKGDSTDAMSRDAILERLEDTYFDASDRKLSQATKTDMDGLTLYQYTILAEDGKVVPCSINIGCDDKGTANFVIIAYMKNDNSTDVKEIVDVWAYMIAAFDPELSPWQGYMKVAELQEKNKITENGYEYTYFEDKLSLMIYCEEPQTQENSKSSLSPDAKVSSNAFKLPDGISLPQD